MFFFPARQFGTMVTACSPKMEISNFIVEEATEVLKWVWIPPATAMVIILLPLILSFIFFFICNHSHKNKKIQICIRLTYLLSLSFSWSVKFCFMSCLIKVLSYHFAEKIIYQSVSNVDLLNFTIRQVPLHQR